MRAATTDAPASDAIGVVIPTLNEAALLPRLLARLLGPDVQGLDRADEVVVADGGSTDETRALAREFGAHVVAAPRGRGAQLAAGADRASAEVLVFLHADCVPAPGALAELRRAFREPAFEAGAMCQRIEARGVFFRLVERAANARSRREMVLGDAGLAVRRGAYRAVGGFRPVDLFEDVDLSRRLRLHCRVRYLAEARLLVSARRWQGEGTLRCTLRNWMLRVMYGAGVAPERLARLYPPHSRPTGPS